MIRTAVAKNKLLTHFYSNCDCLYATAIARQIKQDFPDYRLTRAIASNCKNSMNIAYLPGKLPGHVPIRKRK